MNAERGEIWRRLGAPTDQHGSVNDPRTRQERGLVWNEKWIYRGADGIAVVRVILWNRYDLAGVFRAKGDGGFEPEPLPES